MNWFKRITNKEDKNPYYEKIKKLLHSNGLDKDMIEAHYVGGCVYSEDALRRVLQAVEDNTLEQLLKEVEYDTQMDNIELYQILYSSGSSKLLVIRDSFEPFEAEQVLKVLPISQSLLISTSKIYSS